MPNHALPPHSLARVALAVVALLSLLGSAALPAGVPAAHAETVPIVSADPASAAPGEPISIRGSGWPAGAQLGVRMYEASAANGPSAAFATATADASGSFSIQAAVPFTLFGVGSRGNLNVVPGSYVIAVASGPSLSASAPLTVGAPRSGALLWGEAYFDLNGDGQRDPGDVSASWLVDVAIRNAVHASPTLHAIADARGRYLLTPIGPGYYSVTADAQFRSAAWAASATAWVPEAKAVRVDLPLRAREEVSHPERCFHQTGFCVDSDAFWDYFIHRGGVATFGYPVSRTFQFLGFRTQFFQRLVLQEVPGQGVQRLNLLDPGLLPYNRINDATFPVHDPAVAAAAPRPDTPDYGQVVLRHLRAWVPDSWEGLPVRFLQTYLSAAPASPGDFPALVALEVLGFPTSRPMRDPNNLNFVYQRFQRGILHFQGTDARGNAITGGILLADWFKSLLTGRNLPADLEAQAQMDNSRYLRQYCPDAPNWVCRPDVLPDTDLSFAFERQLLGQQ